MKTIITTCLLTISSLIYGQERLNITIIGTAHHFSDEYKELQGFDKAQQFIEDQNPYIICIEATPTYDTLSLKEIFPSSMRKAAQLRDSLNHAGYFNIGDKNSLEKKAVSFYTQYDFWNGYYNWYQLQKSGGNIEAFAKYQKKLSNSEYGLIVFPAAVKLKQERLFGIDYRYGEDEFLANNQKVLKKLLFSFKWKPLGTYLKTQKQYKKAEKEGKLMEYINGDLFQNSFSELIDELPRRLPKSEEARQVKEYWLNRNKKMAERIVSTAEEQNANRILLTVGSAHVSHIKRFLEEDGHAVMTYGEFIQNQNK